MAKGQISEHELENSLRAIGDLGGITSSGARRDSPFGSDFVRKSQTIVPSVVQPAVALVSGPNEEPQRDASLISEASMVTRAAKPSRLTRKTVVETEHEEQVTLRSFGEKVTVQMSPEMRDDVNYLATKLQRRRTNKKQRITANTVMRGAIQFLLDELKLGKTDIANTEEEFLELMKRKILRDSRL